MISSSLQLADRSYPGEAPGKAKISGVRLTRITLGRKERSNFRKLYLRMRTSAILGRFPEVSTFRILRQEKERGEGGSNDKQDCKYGYGIEMN
jgi:hypothetical protein